MKILDRYILVSFLKTFFTVFIILMFIFVLQTVWLFIGELAGKELDTATIFKFLLYFTPKLMPMVLPLTILLTSIMTFGNFAENYEFAAMKSSGISLQRAMMSLMVFIGFVSITAFYFANNVIPYSEYKFINLKQNIAQLKPAMAITEGTFNDLGSINIKVDEKTGDNDQFLHDVIIHQKSNLRGNFTVIKAKEGELVGKEGSNTLSLILKDGNYYDEIQMKDRSKQKNHPFAKSYFETYTINIDLTEFNDVDLEEEKYTNSQSMLKVSELNETIDSLSSAYNKTRQEFSKNMLIRSGAHNLSMTASSIDSVSEIKNSVLELYSAPEQVQLINLAIGSVNGANFALKAKNQEFQRAGVSLNKFEIALHEKYVFGFACIVLFFVGAPLGAIIRKGGMGLPMVIAILIFLTYHFLGIFAKNSAEEGGISPAIATWLSTAIMFPLGIFLTYRATTDRGLFQPLAFFEPIKNLLKKYGIIKSEEN
ncbi:MAG TPA: LptF/LptG family permease [Salinimicrobium sp.]|nr:LptF/LptG family permease [Salinimicrobium sp.]